MGTAGWVERTSGRLTTAERQALLRLLGGQIAVGRLRLALGVHPDRHAYLPDERITPPTSVLTRAPHCNAR